MSWLRLDDGMLEHEKWGQAIREGGDAVLLVWFRLTSWCSRRLTDGRIPSHMVTEVARLERSKSRTRALRALVESGLCTRHIDGAIVISGYLDRNPSAASVREERDRRAKAQKDYADRKKLTGQQPIRLPGPDPVGHPPPDNVPSQSRPNPVPIPTGDPPVSPTTKPTRTRRTTRPRTALPTDLAPGPTEVSLARTHRVDLDIEMAKFRDHHLKHGSIFSDWHAAIRTWIRGANKFSAPHGATDDRLRAQAARVAMLRECEAAEERAGGAVA